jgi:hypothetical protein
MAGSVFEDDGFQQRRPRNIFPVKGFRMDLGADFKRLFGVVFGVR